MAEKQELVRRAVRHIAAFRPRMSIRLLDVLYGTAARPLRTQVAALLLGRKVTGSDRMAGYGECRRILLEAAGVGQGCVAEQDAEFERRAAEILAAGPEAPS